MRAIFKESLIEVIHDIKKDSSIAMASAKKTKNEGSPSARASSLKNPASPLSDEKQLEAQIGSFKRQIMLGGIEALKVHTEIMKIQDKNQKEQALKLAQKELGANKMRGKHILEALQGLKLTEDENYFNRQTYAEFMKDPLGRVLKQRTVTMHPEVRKRQTELIVNFQKLQNRAIDEGMILEHVD